jgi:serine/threonine protein kinase
MLFSYVITGTHLRNRKEESSKPLSTKFKPPLTAFGTPSKRKRRINDTHSIAHNHIDDMLQLDQTESNPSPTQPHDASQVVVLSMENVTKESTLGVGGFNTVFGVKVHAIDGFSQDRLYALKRLNDSSSSSERHVRHGGRDLAIEARLLSKLNHENIIKVHGISDATFSGLIASSANCHDHFLLLEALEKETLEDQLEYLAKSTTYHDKEGAMDRVNNIATGIAKGLAHLHENDIVLRDLKPANVGFDKSGCVKLFDLGLARDIHTIGERDVAGTLSYLASEIVMGQKASLKSDIYSFGIILWELISLKRAFKKYSSCPMQFKENVLVASWRPPLSTIPTNPLRNLVNDCWDSDPEKRPHITKVLEVLNMESPYWSSPKKISKSKLKLLKTFVSPLTPLVNKILFKRPSSRSHQSSLEEASSEDASLEEAYRRKFIASIGSLAMEP